MPPCNEQFFICSIFLKGNYDYTNAVMDRSDLGLGSQ